MYALIKDGELVGTSNRNEDLEEGISTIEYDDGIQGELILENGVVRAKTKKEIKDDAKKQAENIAWQQLRGERNRLLVESEANGKGLSDKPFTDDEIKYRQELRDLPANTSKPASPSWPKKPEGQH